jgi:hypothetical protein
VPITDCPDIGMRCAIHSASFGYRDGDSEGE